MCTYRNFFTPTHTDDLMIQPPEGNQATDVMISYLVVVRHLACLGTYLRLWGVLAPRGLPVLTLHRGRLPLIKADTI